jgi:hypothetical protein
VRERKGEWSGVLECVQTLVREKLDAERNKRGMYRGGSGPVPVGYIIEARVVVDRVFHLLHSKRSRMHARNHWILCAWGT